MDSLFLLFASILAVYNISAALDGEGNPTVADADSPGAGILSYVLLNYTFMVKRIYATTGTRNR